jgi:hypothetical protein
MVMETKNGKTGEEECATPEKERPIVRIGPVREKIEESRDNLSGRARWFSRRSGERRKS